ncbi:hypothetical protein TWF694_001612 [Orbilia ellipsospora]|uniref:Large ribosomal subunit protein bL32m n=1 Tax=Orbilia ellipsospora TaxID=2528407 RepID=A0AAV9X4B6_9PEZI
MATAVLSNRGSVSMTSLLSRAMSSRLKIPLLFSLPTLTLGLQWNTPPIISQIWDSILKAVPKKKQSHSRKRMRQLAGKALQDVISLNECPGCGATKRAHHLCPTCVDDIREMWKAGTGLDVKETPSTAPSGGSGASA